MKTHNEYEKIADNLHKAAKFQSFPFLREVCEDGARAVRELSNFREKVSAKAQESGTTDLDSIKGHWLVNFICPVCGEHSRQPARECPFCHTVMIETEEHNNG